MLKIKGITVFFLLATLVTHVQGQERNKRILVMGLDTLQFYSDAFHIDSLAAAYSIERSDVPKLFGAFLTDEIVSYDYDRFSYFSVFQKEIDSVRWDMDYVTLQNRLGDEYLGIVPYSEDQSRLLNLIEKYKPDYILSLNLYELLALTDSVNFGDSVRHVVHFDLFDKNLKSVNSGRLDMDTDEYDLYYLDWFYKDIALDQILWIKAYEKDPDDIQSAYYTELDNYFKQSTSISNRRVLNITLGTGMPYGGIGFGFGNVFATNWEWDLGWGFDFSGLRAGIGFKHYVLGASGLGPRPFVGLNYSLASGFTFNLGGEKDEFGNQIDPDDVTRFKIFGDHGLHLRFGFNILVDRDVAINPSIGYAFAFRRQEPEILSGPDKTGRTNFVRFMSFGGLEIGMIISVYR